MSNTGDHVMQGASGIVTRGLTLREFTFTDAQIKALPTTPILFGTAPGAGFWNNILYCTLILDTTAGAYTNINVNSCLFSITHSGLVMGPVNDSTSSPALALATLIFGSAHKIVYAPHVPYSEAFTVAGTSAWVLNPTYDTTASLSNKQFEVAIDNNGSGNFTGGNAANSLIIRLAYITETLP